MNCQGRSQFVAYSVVRGHLLTTPYAISYLVPFLFDNGPKVSFTTSGEVVLETGHELSHVSHHNVRTLFFAFEGAGQKMSDTLSE